MINSTLYVAALLVYLLRLKDISLFLLEDKEVIKLTSKVLLAEVVVRLAEEAVEEVLTALVIVKTIKAAL